MLVVRSKRNLHNVAMCCALGCRCCLVSVGGSTSTTRSPVLFKRQVTVLFPHFVDDVLLVKQYNSSVIYRWRVSSMEYELTNTTGAEILELCTGSYTTEEISNMMAQRYSEKPNVAWSMVHPFIIESMHKGYVEMLDGRRITEGKRKNIRGGSDLITPLVASIELTRACPLRCLHCYNNSGTQLDREMPTDTIIEVFDKLAAVGVCKVFITGGEPTTRDDFPQILSHASRSFTICTVATNGYLLTDDIISQINGLPNVVFQVSVDGSPANHNSIRGRADAYNRAISAIRRLVAQKIPVTVSCTVNALNRHDIEQVISTTKQLGGRQVVFGKTNWLGRAKEHGLACTIDDIYYLTTEIQRLRAIYQDDSFLVGQESHVPEITNIGEGNTCGAGWFLVNIAANGDVMPCSTFTYPMGNIITQSVGELFGWTKVEKLKRLRVPSTSLCGGCPDLFQCDGCMGMAYNIGTDSCCWKTNALGVIGG